MLPGLVAYTVAGSPIVSPLSESQAVVCPLLSHRLGALGVASSKVKVQDARRDGGESGPLLPSTAARAVHVMDTSPPLPYLLAAFCRSAWLSDRSAVVPDGVSTFMLALEAKVSRGSPLA